MVGITSRSWMSTATRGCSRASSLKRCTRLLLTCITIALFTQSCGVRSNPRFQPSNDETVRPAQRRASPNYVSRDDVVDAAERYLGVTYRYGGEDRKGMDCSGLVWRAWMDAGGDEIPRTSRQLFQTGIAVAPGQERRGDLVFFATSGKSVNHVGITDGRGRFIHASSSRGVVWDELGETYWITHYRGARRLHR